MEDVCLDVLGHSKGHVYGDVEEAVLVETAGRRLGSTKHLELAQRRSVLVHLLVGAVAFDFGARAPAADVTSTANQILDGGGMSPVHRQAQLAFVETAAAAYFHWFSPHDWSFVGYEQIHHGVAFDLVWTRDGRVMADELKSGIQELGAGRSRLRSQLEAQAEAGALQWGDAFLGVRPVRLGGAVSSHSIQEEHLVSV